MVRNLKYHVIVGLAILAQACPLRADVVSPIIINEIRMLPPSGEDQFVELHNRSSQTIDMVNWWICDHAGSRYLRVLQIPEDSNCPPDCQSFSLGPGDFLDLRFHIPEVFPPPISGDYSVYANASGTTTHVWRVFVPVAGYFLHPEGNFSIWDQSPPSDPNSPSFDLPNAIRDFIAWGPNAIYTGPQRGCIASSPLVGLWPPPLMNNCAGAGTPVFTAVDTSSLQTSHFSINFRGTSANDPTDYFIAPSTEGERNIMPGDIDDDFDMDLNDYDLFVGCLNLPADPPTCSLADLNHDLVVDCLDWPLFAANWQQYSTLPLPQSPCVPCTPGDFNNDGLVNGDDLQGSIAAFTGTTSPCAVDIDENGVVNCEDVQAFARTLLAAPSDCHRGDVNFDTQIDGADIQPFITILMTPPPCLSPAEICAADINGDQAVTIDDIDPFVLLLTPLEK
jgi:hypothetical protein